MFETELYILTLDTINLQNRIYTKEVIDNWIDNIYTTPHKGYKIEYSINIDCLHLKTLYIKNFLFCGLVKKIRIDKNKNVFATCKLKNDDKKFPFNNDNNNVLVPKGLGIVNENKIYKYELIGFNLIKSNYSPFVRM